MRLGYISVKLLKVFEDELSVKIAELGCKPISRYPFHVTLMFDDAERDEPLCIINPDIIYEATITGFRKLGKAIVADLHSPGLHTEFKRLTQAGYKHSFETLQLHMSLVWEPTSHDLNLIETGLFEWLGKTLQFSEQTLRDNE